MSAQSVCRLHGGDSHRREDPQLFCNRGEAWFRSNQMDRRQPTSPRRFGSIPVKSWHTNGGAEISLAAKEFDRAIADFDVTLRLLPNDAGTYVHARFGLAWQERPRPAIADYARAIRLEPNNVVAWNDRGRAWMAAKNYDKAITDFTEVHPAPSERCPRVLQPRSGLAGKKTATRPLPIIPRSFASSRTMSWPTPTRPIMAFLA